VVFFLGCLLGMEFFMPRKKRRAPKSATFYIYRRGDRLFSY
jgi:cbb3-type cytochrome oxidase subunit 3